METCLNCDGEAYLLGTLGNLNWFRCRYCGSEFSIKKEVEDETETERSSEEVSD